MQLSTLSAAALTDISQIADWSADFARTPIELPEPDVRLDLASKAGDTTRIFKHLHQTCVGHVYSYLASMRVKTPYLCRFYLDSVKAENPLAIFASARSILEFAAFAYRTSRHLRALGPESEKPWLERGQAFFRAIVIARYATSDPDRTLLLQEMGVPKADLKPPVIKHLVDSLAEVSGCEDAPKHYKVLCDFTHHSLSSQAAAKATAFNSSVPKLSNRVSITTPAVGRVSRYSFPTSENAQIAAETTATRAATHLHAAIDAHNETPESPFSKDEIVRFTGNRFGAPVTPVPR